MAARESWSQALKGGEEREKNAEKGGRGKEKERLPDDWENLSRIFINYWTRSSKISRFVGGEQINYLPMPKAEANN